MKKFIVYLYSSISVLPLIAGVVPTAVQVPSAFNSQSITTNTSRYFMQRINFLYAGNEGYAFSLQNTGNRIARISAIGCANCSSSGVGCFSLHCYKNGIISQTNYTAINNSTLQISTTGYFSAGYDEVYTLQAVGVNAGGVRGFEYIPKELYSVTVAPGETLIVSLVSNNAMQYTAIIMWEEIVN